MIWYFIATSNLFIIGADSFDFIGFICLLKICSFSFPFKKLVPFIIEVQFSPEIIWLRIDLATLGSKITGNLPVGALVDPILSKTF